MAKLVRDCESRPSRVCAVLIARAGTVEGLIRWIGSARYREGRRRLDHIDLGCARCGRAARRQKLPGDLAVNLIVLSLELCRPAPRIVNLVGRGNDVSLTGSGTGIFLNSGDSDRLIHPMDNDRYIAALDELRPADDHGWAADD